MNFQYYKDKKGEWRFRIVARNGRIVASGEGYTTKANMMKTIGKVINLGEFTKVEEIK